MPFNFTKFLFFIPFEPPRAKIKQNIIIAYEPVWAIGTGLTADENQIELAHLKIKEILFGLYPKSQHIPSSYSS